MNESQIRVLLVDDHAVVRAGFKLLLSSVPGMQVCGEVDRGEKAVLAYQSQQPDIVVMDLSMPGIGGFATIRRILQFDSQAKILVFSVHHEQVYVHQALKLGAKGYITKNSAPEILPQSITSIMQGQQYVEPGLLKDAQVHDYRKIINAFTAREFDVFRLLAQGLTAHSIADELCISYKTAVNYATQIKKKLNASNAAKLMQIALSEDIISKPKM